MMRTRSTAVALDVLLATALDAHHGPKSITIKAAAKKQAPVVFSQTKNPFHIACINCHKTEKKGPTSCAACHKKA